MVLIWLRGFHNGLDGEGNPYGNDFVTFWGAAQAALAGHAAEAYDAAKIGSYERLAVPASQRIFGWFYPPSFYLMVLPLGRIPYLWAYLGYITATLALFVSVVRQAIRGREAMWCLAAFSGVWINCMDGQNGFLTAALAGAALMWLERRPWLAGVLIGLLSIKPHLALLFPVALVAIGAWRTIVAAALTAAALLGAGTAVLGEATLRAWLGSIHVAGLLLEQGGLPWQKMPAVFAMVRLLHGPVWLAYGLHLSVAVVAAGVVWWVWRRSADGQMRGAVLMTATFLISPYVFDYDLVWLAFPIAWMALIGLRDGFGAWERETMVAAFLLPLVMAPIAATTSLQTGPVVLGTMLWCMVRRVAVTNAVAEEQPGKEKGQRLHAFHGV